MSLRPDERASRARFGPLVRTFLPEGHISYYTTGRGPDILRDVIVSGICCILPNKQVFRKYLIFHCWKNVFAAGWKGFAGEIRPAGRSLDTPTLDSNSETHSTRQRWNFSEQLRSLRHGVWFSNKVKRKYHIAWTRSHLPGMMLLPGSFSGSVNSPKPHRGPDAKNLQKRKMADFRDTTSWYFQWGVEWLQLVVLPNN